jgi:streptomycin 6-kinase
VEIAVDPARLRRRLAIVSGTAGLDPKRLLDWIYAYAVLGAAWSLESGHDPGPGLAIAALARAERTA